MSRMSRTLLEAMNRFVLDSGNGDRRHVPAPPVRWEEFEPGNGAGRYTAVSHS